MGAGNWGTFSLIDLRTWVSDPRSQYSNSHLTAPSILIIPSSFSILFIRLALMLVYESDNHEEEFSSFRSMFSHLSHRKITSNKIDQTIDKLQNQIIKSPDYRLENAI